tara:strand:- start:591 stop:836 length:246 start_codon:yes stop_codon:yes gene_type:complete
MNKIIIIIPTIILLISCGDTYSDNYNFTNQACRQAVTRGYPSEICDCIDNELSSIKNPLDITGDYIDKIVKNCTENTLNIY